MRSPTVPAVSPRGLHVSARLEDAVGAAVYRLLRRLGWRPQVLPYIGYGSNGWVRILGRVLLAPASQRPRDVAGRRGWRRFLAVTARGINVTVQLGTVSQVLVSARGGYLDAVVEAQSPAGWHDVIYAVDAGVPVTGTVRIVGPEEQLGLLSDIDDTVLVTSLPRPFLAFWNTFVLRETARRPVPGMVSLYRDLAATQHDLFTVYLSTGAWNSLPAIEAFLARHGYPPGPLLLTDWGPTEVSWFRSGQEHKRAQLRRLIADLPQITWVLVGDDGQHDPTLYDEAVAGAPSRVRAVAIRQLSVAQQLLAHGGTNPPNQGELAEGAVVPNVLAGDGFGLADGLRRIGVLPPLG